MLNKLKAKSGVGLLMIFLLANCKIYSQHNIQSAKYLLDTSGTYFFNFITNSIDSVIGTEKNFTNEFDYKTITLKLFIDSNENAHCKEILWKRKKDSVVVQSGKFKNGIADGQFVIFEGTDSSYTNYSNGLKNGIERESTGSLYRVSHYKSGKREGQSILYSKNSNKTIEIDSYSDGVLHGVSCAFYLNTDNIRYCHTYNNGKIANGNYYIFHPNGMVFVKGHIWKAKYHGKFEIFDEHGAIKEIIHYYRGMRHGKTLKFMKDTTLIENFYRNKSLNRRTIHK